MYIVSDKIMENMREIEELFDFKLHLKLDNVGMIGLNVYYDKIIVKLYSIFNNPTLKTLMKNFPNYMSLPEWARNELSKMEVFIGTLPQINDVSSIAFPTLSNPKIKELIRDIPFTNGLFYKKEIYPSWLSFNPQGELDIIYFKPKRDYLYNGLNGNVIFRDKDYNDYLKD
jgi:hypothetical protein